jgi:hypothetical protein
MAYDGTASLLHGAREDAKGLRELIVLIPTLTISYLAPLAAFPATRPPNGLAERGPGGWRRDGAALADVAESTGAADIQRER